MKALKKEKFKEEISWNEIIDGRQEEWMEEVRELILEILHQMKHYLPLDDSYINLFKVLNPNDFDRDCWISLANNFPNLVPSDAKFIDEGLTRESHLLRIL